MNKRIVSAAAILAATVMSLTGCNSTSKPSSQKQAQAITEQYSQRLTTAVPYPLAEMNDSLERANLRERLLRYNQPSKISYVYVLSYDGHVLNYYTIKGKVSSTQSQMTNTQNIQGCPNTGNSGQCGVVVDSMGDDGSYGSEEGGQNGIFFFTTDNVLVETSMPFVVTDAPEKINPDRTLSYVDGSKPSSTSAQPAH